MTDSLSKTLNALLQAQWNQTATGLAVTDVYWSNIKYEALDQLSVITENVIISVYNPSAPTVSTPMSREMVKVDERVIVDILIKPSSTADADVQAAMATRENIIRWLQATIQTNQFKVSGYEVMQADKELVKAESPPLIRSAWLILGTNWLINTALR
jgi:hypothetical protein